jgi:hypothetical protein
MKPLSISVVALAVLTVIATAQPGPYRFAVNQPYKYFIEGKTESLSEMMGQTNSSTSETTGSVIVTADKALEDGKTHIVLKVDKVMLMIDGPQGSQTLGNDLTGKEFGFTIESTGRITDQDSLKEQLSPESMQVLPRLLLFIRLKTENLQPGKEWEDIREDTLGTEDDKLLQRTKMNYVVKGEETVNNHKCLVIQAEGTTEMSGNADGGNMEIHIDEKVTIKEKILFDVANGVLVQRSKETSTEREIRDANGTSFKANVSATGTQKIELVSQ